MESLEIFGFRAFRHFRIGSVGNINLIVGKNNRGKSTLLEAIYVYTQRASPHALWELSQPSDDGGQPFRLCPSHRTFPPVDEGGILNFLRRFLFGLGQSTPLTRRYSLRHAGTRSTRVQARHTDLCLNL